VITVVTGTRILKRLWLVLGILLLLTLLFPIGFGKGRLFILIAVPLFWLGALYFSWPVKWLCTLWIIVGLAGLLLTILPGRDIAPDTLRSLYVQHLHDYEGTRYLLGGENKIGIDCSGLVRLALVDAYLHLGLVELNPAAVRQALSLWLQDASALALSTGYRGLTQYITNAASIQTLDHTLLWPGDLAVTQDGQHVLAYLGHESWIQAEPSVMHVIINTASDKQFWLSVPVNVVRWSTLAQP
jgi:hypothetical protein